MSFFHKLKNKLGLDLAGKIRREIKYYSKPNSTGSIDIRRIVFDFKRSEDINAYSFSASSLCSDLYKCNDRLTLFQSKKYKLRILASQDMTFEAMRAQREYPEIKFFLPRYDKSNNDCIGWDTYVNGKFITVASEVVFSPSCMNCLKALPSNKKDRTCSACGEPVYIY